MPKVYVINKGGHDYSRATRFGTLVYCSEGLVAKSDIGKMYRIMSAAMKDSAAEDYILISGLSSMCSVACGIFGAKHNRLNLLIFWDGGYVERKVHFDNLLNNALENNDGEGNTSAVDSGQG